MPFIRWTAHAVEKTYKAILLWLLLLPPPPPPWITTFYKIITTNTAQNCIPFINKILKDEGTTLQERGRRFYPRWCHWNFSLTQTFRPHCGPGVDSASNRNEYQEYFLGGRSGRWVGLTTLPPSSANCLEIWQPQPPATLWACNRPEQGLLYLYCTDLQTIYQQDPWRWRHHIPAKCRELTAHQHSIIFQKTESLTIPMWRPHNFSVNLLKIPF